MSNQNPSHPTSANSSAGATAAQQATISCPPGVSEVTITIRFAPVSQALPSGNAAAGAVPENQQEKKPRRLFGEVPDLDTMLKGSSFYRPE